MPNASQFQAVQGSAHDTQPELLGAAGGESAIAAGGVTGARLGAPSASEEARRALRRFDELLEERDAVVVHLAEAGVPEEWVARFDELLVALRAEVETLSAAMQEAD